MEETKNMTGDEVSTNFDMKSSRILETTIGFVTGSPNYGVIVTVNGVSNVKD
jgi:hypothetical protein